jgi:hypothetical protein
MQMTIGPFISFAFALESRHRETQAEPLGGWLIACEMQLHKGSARRSDDDDDPILFYPFAHVIALSLSLLMSLIYSHHSFQPRVLVVVSIRHATHFVLFIWVPSKRNSTNLKPTLSSLSLSLSWQYLFECLSEAVIPRDT